VPSTSKKQHNFMAAIANNPSFAKKVGVPQSVGKDFTSADKGKTFKKGGGMKKFEEGGLSNAETRMVPYGKLSDKRKAEIKSQYENDVKKAGANVKRPFGSKVLDAYYEMNPLVSEKQRQSVRSDATEDVAQRQRKLDYAEGQLKGLGTRKEYFSDDAPHKIDPNEKLFRKGGSVKESKAMVGKEVAFMKKKGAPASMIKHEKAEMGMKKGGMPMKDGKPAFMMGKKMNMGGMAGYAKGGGIESRGKTKGTVVRMASGGSVSARADGIAQRGKTKFKMC
jgi:hypothetical protein